VVSFCRTYKESEIYGVDIELTNWNKNKNAFKLTNSEKKKT